MKKLTQIEKTIILNGKKVKVLVPSRKVSKKELESTVTRILKKAIERKSV